MLVSVNVNTHRHAKAVVLVGLLLQVAFFGFFLVNGLTFWFRMRNSGKEMSNPVPWQKHTVVLFVTSIFILGRCIFRVVEYAEGTHGNVMSHEAYMYILDAGFMLIVMLAFHFYHPSEVNALLKEGKAVFLFHVYSPRRPNNQTEV
jgi:hypothetical protein